jgi:hypothetical protein
MFSKPNLAGRCPQEALAFLVEIIQFSTEYSLIGEGLDGKIFIWNEGTSRLYGYEATKVLHKVLHNTFPAA